MKETKYNLVRQLDAHRKAGVTLYGEWEAATDEESARACHSLERDNWQPELMALIQKLDPALIARYEILTPFEAPRTVPSGFAAWDGVVVGFAALTERLARLQQDVTDLARKHRVDLLVADVPAVTFATKAETWSAYDERVRAERELTGAAPTTKDDEAWRKEHGLSRVKMRELRNNSPARTDKDRMPGRRE